MKKLFSCFMALACALFVGVSCTPSEEPQDPKAPVIAVTNAPEANFAPEAGEFTLNYTIENPVQGKSLEVSTEAAWLTVGEIAADAVPFTYEANSDTPGSEPREAVITFAYEGAESVVVTVKQDAQAPHFSVTFTDCTTTSAKATITPVEGVGTYYWKKASSSELEGFESHAAWLQNKISTAWFVTLSEGELANQSITEYYGEAYIIIAGAVEGDSGYEFTTPVYTFKVPLVPKPVLTISELAHTVSHESGVITLDYTVEHGVEGVNPTVSTKAGWVHTTIEAGKITIAYDANEYAKARTASLSFSYEGADAPQVVTIEQAANPNAETITFTLEVTESHFDHVIVNVTPSNTNVKYALKGISKSDFEGYTYNSSDATLQERDLTSSYYKPTILTGVQTGYKLSIDASKAEDWYIYAYAVSEDETVATSDVVKTLVLINYDKPTLSFEKAPFEVSAEGGVYKVKYIVTNPVEGGVVKFNGSQNNYNGVLKDNSWKINTETCEVEFEVNPYDASQYSHYATLYIAYYANETSTTSIATASLKVNQLAPAN